MSIFAEIKNRLVALFRNKAAILLFWIVLLLMLYGYHGNLDLLKLILPEWTIPGSDPGARTPILPWIPWDREFISFMGGAILLVLIPCLILWWKFHESPCAYGMGWPAKDKRAGSLAIFLLLTLGSAVPFYFAAKNPDMQALYPFYRSFTGLGQFILYEISYFPFFLVIEFVFRGLILFSAEGQLQVENPDTGKAALAILIAMMPYCVWHIGKPLTELWGTPVWGLIAGASALVTRSIWPVLMAHWILNIWLDGQILHNLGLAPFA